MPWARMRFKDQRVLVRVDDAGRPVLDADGRAEMKYRESDARSYRPGPGNLTPDADQAGAPADDARPRRGPRAQAGRQPPLYAGAPDALHVWTDGACSGNPGPMGIGVVVVDDGKRHELGEYLGIGTNNIAELTAIERGLALAQRIAAGRDRPIRVYSDSGYALGLLGQAWKAKANQELVARLRRVVSGIPRIEWVKVAGHAGIPENERCDELAREAIETAVRRG